MLAFIPYPKYVSVSITGDFCELNCKYCRGHYLKGMIKAESPQALYWLARRLAKRGVKGLLVSGGFDKEGKLPIKPYLSALRSIKEELGLVISVHAGMVDLETAKALRRSKVDVINYEVILDDVVMRDLMNLRDKGGEDCLKSLEALIDEGPPFIAPHVPVGFHYGRVVHEFEALEVISDYNPYVVILLIYTPLRGKGFPPPPLYEVMNLISYAKRKVKGELALGCIRPKEFKELLDPILIKEGLMDRIVLPALSLIRKYKLMVVGSCCSLPKELLVDFL